MARCQLGQHAFEAGSLLVFLAAGSLKTFLNRHTPHEIDLYAKSHKPMTQCGVDLFLALRIT